MLTHPRLAREAGHDLGRTISKFPRNPETSNAASRRAELESGIEELSESFLLFSNLLFEVGILQNQPRVTAALQKITQQYVSLAKSGCDEAEQAPTAPADESQPTSPTVSDTRDIISNNNPLITQLGSLPIIGDAF
ncbi:uncharacterized protein N7458_004304 [Penicillium daleae]|uniref:Uncharacterized protein n=1 Tax=Penicillium daleae TaxID=63821 RepID=A0AAD6G598_9EURO|nr:uncharacterized protein N7458_004304 [Penicillium daleae]KAJ5456040.1 hypothetical protein N7458_004304 [Penicillium daleae]